MLAGGRSIAEKRDPVSARWVIRYLGCRTSDGGRVKEGVVVISVTFFSGTPWEKSKGAKTEEFNQVYEATVKGMKEGDPYTKHPNKDGAWLRVLGPPGPEEGREVALASLRSRL